MKFSAAVLLFLPALLLCGCGKNSSNRSSARARPSGAAAISPAASESDAAASAPLLGLPGEIPVMILRPGENPLWFEVSADASAFGGGLRHIESPGEAEMVPFTPWPLARHVAALLEADGGLYLAINRDSLLAVLPLENNDIGLYRVTGTPYWESYTVGNLFLYDDAPTVFFYRDDRFAEPSPLPPTPPALSLRPGSGAYFIGVNILALNDIPFAEGWEADILRPGADGRWYYRASRSKNGGRETRYFRSAALSQWGEGIDAAAYRDSQPAPESGEAVAALPQLPENYVYSHIARLGDLVFASWEEQEDYNIGAAGFMVFKPGPNTP